MKTAVVVGLFVLVACLQLQADAVECTGEPEGGRKPCEQYTCNEITGQYMITRCEDVVPRCTGRDVYTFIEADSSESFPDCCARPVCHPWLNLVHTPVECTGEPEGGRKPCEQYTCNEITGQYMITRCEDVVPRCTGRDVYTFIEADSSESFPDCCARPVCRPWLNLVHTPVECTGEPEGGRKPCEQYTCNEITGQYMITRCEDVVPTRCTGRDVYTFIEADSSESFPDCCARPVCRPWSNLVHTPVECTGEPEGGRKPCEQYTCNEITGQYTITRCEDVVPRCTGRDVYTFIEADSSESFPDCCARPVCHAWPNLVHTPVECTGEPEGGRKPCEQYTCNEITGQYIVTRCEDVVPRCTGRAVHTFIKADWNKSFPDCCARPVCRAI